MREILFRGKDIAGNWHYGDLINLTKEIKQICNHNQLEHAHSVNPETVGQYTGLTDKNGKKIFEGDICQTKGYPIIDEKPFEIVWNNYYGGWYWQDLFVSVETDALTMSVAALTKVIGNIHDNPELLKGGAE